MITVTQCAAYAGLAPNELLLGKAPSARHHSLHASYKLHPGMNSSAVREMIVADIRASLELGATRRAADLLIALRLFLSDHPEACEHIPSSAKVPAVSAVRRTATVSIADATAVPAQPYRAGPRAIRKVINLERRAKFRWE